jgi:histidine triad (HIT) family protein
MAYDPNNVFARMVRGEIPCIRLHEDEHTLAFMDIMPQSPGHDLVIPKRAGENLLDSPRESLSAAMASVQRIARAVQSALGASGVIVQQCNGAAAGQTVFHLHVHVIPRHDGVALRPHTGAMADHGVLAGHAARIRTALGA